MSFFQSYLQTMNRHIQMVDFSLMKELADLLRSVSEKGSKVIIVGNGGSAAIASHIAVDLTKNARVRTVDFNEASLITCFANDYGYEKWVEKAIEFYADKNDLVILISSSGMSPNIVNAATKAKEMGLPVITFSGFDSNNLLKQLGTLNFWVNSRNYNIVEMTHNIWLVTIIDYITDKMEY
jgi:D-sedoheptulose 7-phosphate isomerase